MSGAEFNRDGMVTSYASPKINTNNLVYLDLAVYGALLSLWYLVMTSNKTCVYEIEHKDMLDQPDSISQTEALRVTSMISSLRVTPITTSV